MASGASRRGSMPRRRARCDRLHRRRARCARNVRPTHMTRPSARRPMAPRPRSAPALQWNGTRACPPSETRGWRLVTGALIAAFFGLALATIGGAHRVGDYFTESDFYGAYAQGARMIEHGRLVPSRYTVIGPGYEIALALVGFVIRNLFLAAELLSAVSAAAMVGLWAALLGRRVDARLGAAAAAFIRAHFVLSRYAYSATTGTFGIALQAAPL